MGEDETSVRYFLSSVYESAEYVYSIYNKLSYK